MQHLSRPHVIPTFTLTLLMALTLSAAAQDSLQNRRHRQFVERRQRALDDFQFEMQQLADHCRSQGLTDTAAEVEQIQWRANSLDSSTRPSTLIAPPISEKLPAEEFAARQRAAKLQTDCGSELYRLARAALKANLNTMAFLIIGDVLRVDPDHRLARRIIGQEQFHDPARKDEAGYAGEWITPFEKKMRGGRNPHILHPEFGWIPRRDLAKYEDGLRPWKAGWISQEKERLQRQDFSNALELRTEHFLLKTNVPREEAVVVSQQLEAFHQWLSENFAGFFDTPAELEKRFLTAQSRRRRSHTPPPMKILYFRTRNEYLAAIRDKVPPDIETNGLYWQPTSTAYFFSNSRTQGLDTVFHEATHQILDLHTRRARRAAARALSIRTRQPVQEWVLGGSGDFWLIEGLACYFESLNFASETATVGNSEHVRVRAARVRLLRNNYYVPLRIFTRLGKDEFQHNPMRPRLYSQASGVVHFLMHYDHGRYRDALVALLSAVYRPDAKHPLQRPSLAQITGTSFETLDRQYREHMLELNAASQEPVLASQEEE